MIGVTLSQARALVAVAQRFEKPLQADPTKSYIPRSLASSGQKELIQYSEKSLPTKTSYLSIVAARFQLL